MVIRLTTKGNPKGIANKITAQKVGCLSTTFQTDSSEDEEDDETSSPLRLSFLLLRSLTVRSAFWFVESPSPFSFLLSALLRRFDDDGLPIAAVAIGGGAVAARIQ